MTGPETVSASVGGTAYSGAPDVIELAQARIRAPSPNPPGDERAVAALLEESIAVAAIFVTRTRR